MYAYVNAINQKYYLIFPKKYSIHNLRSQAAINFFDPYQFISFYHFANYLMTGKNKGKMYMLKFRNIHYLPSFNIALTPFGSEFYFNNYFKISNHTLKIYGRYGDPTFKRFWGAGASFFNIIKNRYFYFNSNADIWNQPSLLMSNKNIQFIKTEKGYGGSVSGTIGISILQNKLNLIMQTGYKTNGFLQGENLSKGFFVRAGIGFISI